MFSPNDYVISITDPNSNDACIRGTGNILRVSFYDIDKRLETNGKFYEPINDSQAYQIVSFVGHAPGESDVYVHCEAGISRSSGVAAALAKCFIGREAGEEIFKRYLPNRYVYSKIIEAFMMD